MIHLSIQSAQQIVNEISTIVKQHINMMDAQGYIIASTDPKRVGQFHEGAQKVIQQKLNQVVVQYDDEYNGTKKGVNLPIVFENEIVGVIGITGDSEQVGKYGQIIKKMTEILLLDTAKKEQKTIDEKIKNRYLDQWLFGDSNNINQLFINRGKALELDITLPRRILIAQIADIGSCVDTVEGQVLIDHIDKMVKKIILKEHDNIFLKNASKIVCLVTLRSDAQMQTLAKMIQEEVLKELGVKLAVGIDSMEKDGYSSIRSSFIKAEKALKASLSSQDKTFKFYKDIGIELFIDEIPKNLKQEYITQIFRNCSLQEIHSWVKLLEIFFESNGSINLTSEKLFIHKNTLQYKLKKLREITGYDPRNLSNAALFYLAILFYKENLKDLNKVL